MIQRIVRRLCRYIANFNQALRRGFYHLISTNRNIIGKPQRMQPVLFLGSEKIVFAGKVTLGYFPSPFFYNGYSHFETRGANSLNCLSPSVKLIY